MNERMKFIVRLLDDGERMSDLCREFGISRKTGYKVVERYRKEGIRGLGDRSHQAKRNAQSTSKYVQDLILREKKDHLTWGAPKIKERLEKKHSNIKIPAISTIHALFDREGLVKKRKKKRYRATGTYLSAAKEPNDVWPIDFKGQFKLGNQEYCYPLTISDQVSRYLLCCDALEGTREGPCFGAMEAVFEEYGLPLAIRSDNGNPFASQALFGLSKLSVWWLKLGIFLERIVPGHPEQNGRHERIHRTLKLETTRPPGQNLLQQQEIFEKFMQEYNSLRPHEALGMKVPKEVYKKSERSYQSGWTAPFEYEQPFDKLVTVSKCGSISFNKKRVFITEPLAGEELAIAEQEDGVWSVCFRNFELGFFDEQSQKLSPGENPFSLEQALPNKKVLPLRSE